MTTIETRGALNDPKLEVASQLAELFETVRVLDTAIEDPDVVWGGHALDCIDEVIRQTSWFRAVRETMLDEFNGDLVQVARHYAGRLEESLPPTEAHSAWWDARDIQGSLQNIAYNAQLRLEDQELTPVQVHDWLMWRLRRTWWINSLMTGSQLRPCPTGAPPTA